MLSPLTEKITSLNPPASLLEILIISIVHPFFEQTFSYIRNKSATNNVASSPPVPALISTMVFFSSSLSLGNKKIFSFFSWLAFVTSAVSNSFCASKIISLSLVLSSIRLLKSFLFFSKFKYSFAGFIISFKSEYSFDF